MAVEARRGCGFRKIGGIYLVSDPASQACDGLPLALDRCPTCGEGIKPTRSCAWVDMFKLLQPHFEALNACKVCGIFPDVMAPCPVRNYTKLNNRDLLIWAGTQHYPTRLDFLQEALLMGISSRVPAAPRDAEPGKTWLFAAHRKGITLPGDGNAGDQQVPAIIAVARLRAIEYIIGDDTSLAQREAIEKRGLTPVVVPHNDKDHQ